MSKPRRPTRGNPDSPSVSVSRATSSSPEDAKKSIRLTVKMPSNKLRSATSGADRRSHNIFTDPVIVTGPRNSRSKRKIVEVDSDEEDEESPEAEEQQFAESDEEESETGDEDADAEHDPDVDADGDVDMEVADPGASKPAVTVTPAAAVKVRNVDVQGTKAGEDEDEDDEGEELSEPESEGEGEEETAAPEDAEGEEEGEEEEEAEDEGEEEGEEEELSESESTPAVGSRASTPDVSKMTKRQRGRVDLGGDFLQLPMEPQVKKQLTAEEHAMRRAEMARRRKNLSEKRNEEEKMDTINKLLKKQAPKRRGKVSAAETAGDATPGIQEPEEVEKPDPSMIRYVSDRDGCRLCVPEEWAGSPAGGVLSKPASIASAQGGMKLVQEIS